MNSDKVKLGMYTPFYPLEDIFKIGQIAEKYGFDSAWVGDHLAGFPKPDAYDAWTATALLAERTKKIRIGVSVTDPHRRHPAVLAQTIATIDILSQGRLIPGIGAGEAMNLNPYGIDWSKPVEKMREFVIVMKKLWEAPHVTFEGRFYRLRNAVLIPRPAQKPHPPVWIASNAAKSLRVTAEVGDGWLPTTETPESYQRKLKEIQRMAREYGRVEESVEPGLFLYSAISEDYNEARTRIKEMMRLPLAWWSYKLKEIGLDISLPGLDITKFEVTENKLRAVEEATANVPFELIENIACFGTPEDFIKRVKQYAKAGLRHVVFVPHGDYERTAQLIGRKVVPYFSK